MTTKPDGGHAYPTNAYEHDEHGNVIPIVGPGMTLRDRIAIAAMQSVLTWPDGWARKNDESYEQALARISYEYAESMLAERERRG